MFADAHESGEVIPGPFQMKLPVRPSGREPDVLFLAKDRCHLLRDTYLDGPADLVVEVISKESRGATLSTNARNTNGAVSASIGWWTPNAASSRCFDGRRAVSWKNA